MLEQERYEGNLDGELMSREEELHPLYQPVSTQDGTLLYFNKFAGYLGRQICKTKTSTFFLGITVSRTVP